MEKNPASNSVWRSLAVAFGDGLAFGVAVTLAKNQTRARLAPGSRPAALPEPPAGGIVLPAAQPASATTGLDGFMLEKVISAVEARLAEQTAQTEKRLAETELRLGLEIKSEQRRDAAEGLRQSLASLEQRLEATEQRLATFERDLPAQLGARIESLVRSLEARLGEAAAQARAELDLRLAAIERDLPAQVDARMTSLGEAAAQARAGLEQRLAAIERDLPAQVDARMARLGEAAAQARAGLEQRLAAIERDLPAQVDARVEGHLRSLEGRLGEQSRAAEHRLGEASAQARAGLEQRLAAIERDLPAQVDARMASLGEAAAQARAELEQRLAAGAQIEGQVRSLEARLGEAAARASAELENAEQRLSQVFESRFSAGRQEFRDRYTELEAISKATAAAIQAAVERTLADLTQALQQLESRTALEFASRSEASGRETGNLVQRLEATLRADLETLRGEWRQQLADARGALDGDRVTLAGELAALRQQASALELMLDSRIAAAVQEGLRALQLEASREQNQKMAALEAELRGHAEAIARLRQKVVEADQGTLRTMVEIARMAQARLDQMAEPAPPAEPDEASPAPKPPAEASSSEPGAPAESDTPRFASADPNGRWRLPLMSGLFLAAMSLAWLRF